MEFLNNYGLELFGVIVVLVIVIIGAVKFFKLPTKEQISKIKEVLLVWVIAAEKNLGGGTGQVKLRYVYDLFIARFPAVANVIKFETFSKWVDEALEQMAELLEVNESLEEYIEKEN